MGAMTKWALVFGLVALGCSSDDGSETKDPGPDKILSLGEGWNEIAPGGDTICSKGTPFRFWVRKGSVNRVVVDFRGGGACWNTLTCAVGDSLFQPEANPDDWMTNDTPEGIYDHARADNPFKDWHHVYIAYCTGDVHWGDAATMYGTGSALETTINHRGAVNARAALSWVYENVRAPEKVFVTGCSAGGYGAALWAAHVREHYQKAMTYLFADSAAGIITDDFFQESFPAWNATASFPTSLGIDPATFTRLPQLYVAFGKTYPETFFSQFNTAYDETQHSYYGAMGGGDAAEWSGKMQDNLTEIETGAPSFRYYLAAGYQHCVITRPELYDVEVGGKKLVQWLGEAVEDVPVQNASCLDSDCGAPAPPDP
jgi:hypothetical protein